MASASNGLGATKKRRGTALSCPRDGTSARDWLGTYCSDQNREGDAAAGEGEDGGDLLIGDSSVQFLRWSCAWDLGDACGGRVRLETHRVIGNGDVARGDALDTGSGVELGTRCSIRAKMKTKDMERSGRGSASCPMYVLQNAHQRSNVTDQTLPAQRLK
uniref:Uncharacterized protein n=1 Tax=Oryza punctata TaxID=4537 RepID=A0A0E0JZC1_ORYPU